VTPLNVPPGVIPEGMSFCPRACCAKARAACGPRNPQAPHFCPPAALIGALRPTCTIQHSQAPPATPPRHRPGVPHRTPWHRPPGQVCGAAQVSGCPAGRASVPQVQVLALPHRCARSARSARGTHSGLRGARFRAGGQGGVILGWLLPLPAARTRPGCRFRAGAGWCRRSPGAPDDR